MLRRPPISTRTDTLVPYTTLFRSALARRRCLRTRTVELSNRFDAEPRLRCRDPAQHHPRPSRPVRSEEQTSELQSLMRISYAVFCLKTKTYTLPHIPNYQHSQHTHPPNTEHKHEITHAINTE